MGFGLGLIAARWSRLWRWIRRRPAVPIHVEKDPQIIFANAPDWVTFPQFLPRPADQLPPAPGGKALEMAQWARNLGGHPASYCDLHITITAWEDRDIVVSSFRVEARAGSLPDGSVLIRGVGGASMESRRLDVKLSTFATSVIPSEPGGQPTDWFSIQLKKGESYQFHLIVNAAGEEEHIDVYEWSGLLDILIGNKRETVRVDDDGRPFRLVNRGRRPELWWNETTSTWGPRP